MDVIYIEFPKKIQKFSKFCCSALGGSEGEGAMGLQKIHPFRALAIIFRPLSKLNLFEQFLTKTKEVTLKTI